MKLGNLTIFLFIIYISIGIFDQVFDANLNAYGNGGTGFLFNTIIQPWNWTGTITIAGFSVPSLVLVMGSIVSIGAGIAIAGSLFGRSDISVLSAMALGFASIGAVPIVALYGFVTRNVGMFVIDSGLADCSIGQPCGPAQLAGALTAGILALVWLFAVIEWWFWRATFE